MIATTIHSEIPHTSGAANPHASIIITRTATPSHAYYDCHCEGVVPRCVLPWQPEATPVSAGLAGWSCSCCLQIESDWAGCVCHTKQSWDRLRGMLVRLGKTWVRLGTRRDVSHNGRNFSRTGQEWVIIYLSMFYNNNNNNNNNNNDNNNYYYYLM
jgi:hypothetical protein